jgi:thioredoxin
MKIVVLYTLLIVALASAGCTGNTKGNIPEGSVSEVQEITGETFKKTIADYDITKVWKYEGSMPAIIDFYAGWCPPCRKLSPLLDEIAKEYTGKLIIYRVNIDKEKELASNFGITNIPTLLYIPTKGNPKVTLGFIPKDKIVKTIKEVLLTK